MASFVTRRDAAKWLGATMIAGTFPPQQTTAGTALALATPESVGFAADVPKRWSKGRDGVPSVTPQRIDRRISDGRYVM